MSSSTPNSPTTAPVATSARSTPGPATRTPLHLGLAGYAGSRMAPPAPRRNVPSLSIRTADGSCVSILNDSEEATSASSSGSACTGCSGASEHKRCSSVPGLSPGSSPANASPFRAQSTPGATTPQQIPSILPSLNTLVQAVGLVTSAETAAAAVAASSPSSANAHTTTPRSHPYYHPSHSHSHTHHHHSSHRTQAAPAAAPTHRAPISLSATVAAPAGTKTTAKRKYKCSYDGCGKAFTTSGHLARHQRIHTGEKNFPCLFPGCSSRFSRQDNMMQHYRTHMSSKSRRNGSPRKVVFVESADPYRASQAMYGNPVYAGSHPIQHQHHHHPYDHSSAAAAAAAAAASGKGPSMASMHSSSAQQGAQMVGAGGHSGDYGLPSMGMLSGPGGAAGSAQAWHEYRAGMAKQSPAPAHTGAMAFY